MADVPPVDPIRTHAEDKLPASRLLHHPLNDLSPGEEDRDSAGSINLSRRRFMQTMAGATALAALGAPLLFVADLGRKRWAPKS